MAFDYINEAFKRLELIDEQLFDTSLDGINKLSDFMNGDEQQETIDVIDPEAETEDDLKDSYIGKVITNCNVCHSHIFENKDEIIIDEEGNVNIEKPCPYCGEEEGFTIVGEIAPFVTDGSEETSEGEVTEALGLGAGLALGGAAIGVGMLGSSLLDDVNDNPEDELLTEDFKEVTITTEDQHMEMTSDDNGKVTVTTEPLSTDENIEDLDTQDIESSDTEETITPISSETETEILTNNDIESSDTEEITDDTTSDEKSDVEISDEAETDVEISDEGESNETENSDEELEEDFDPDLDIDRQLSKGSNKWFLTRFKDNNNHVTGIVIAPDVEQGKRRLHDRYPNATDIDFQESPIDQKTVKNLKETEHAVFIESTETYKEIDIDDVYEEDLNTLTESFLKNVYDNVDSFVTTGISSTPDMLIVEGQIKFTSGKTKKTGFMFEACDFNNRGQVRFNGCNKQLSESSNAFTLVGRVDNNKLFVESLGYNYTVNDDAVRGVIRRK